MSKNRMNYSHDLAETMRDTPLRRRSVLWGADTFIENLFPNAGVRAKKNRVQSFKRRTHWILTNDIEGNIKNPLDNQLQNRIWDENSKQYRKNK